MNNGKFSSLYSYNPHTKPRNTSPAAAMMTHRISRCRSVLSVCHSIQTRTDQTQRLTAACPQGGPFASRATPPAMVRRTTITTVLESRTAKRDGIAYEVFSSRSGRSRLSSAEPVVTRISSLALARPQYTSAPLRTARLCHAELCASPPPAGAGARPSAHRRRLSRLNGAPTDAASTGAFCGLGVMWSPLGLNTRMK